MQPTAQGRKLSEKMPVNQLLKAQDLVMRDRGLAGGVGMGTRASVHGFVIDSQRQVHGAARVLEPTIHQRYIALVEKVGRRDVAHGPQGDSVLTDGHQALDALIEALRQSWALAVIRS